jgi:hydroxypyruvate isomerase
MTRRDSLSLAVAGMAASTFTSRSADAAPLKLKGRIQQGASRWCYNKIPIEELAKACADLGLKAIDLPKDDEIPVIKKYGLAATAVGGGHSIEKGLNDPETHAERIAKLKERIDYAAANGGSSVIVFSGNRRPGLTDEQGIEYCSKALKQVAKHAEDKNILLIMELLNSKVNHKNYQCDHTAWGVEVMKQVNSTHVKLLYDIYHMQIMEGDIIRNIREFHPYLGHYHTGGNPGRNEIDSSQEIYYPPIVEAIIATGFKGYIAHEFIPKRDPLTSLKEAIGICDV